MSAPSFDVATADRWFAVECNNAAWDLVERADRDARDDEELLRAAMASAWHWNRAGTDLHRLRARVLLATAFASLGRWADAAREHAAARDLLAASETAAAGVVAFDLACVAGVHAWIARESGAAAGDRREADASFATALARLEPDDAAVVRSLYAVEESA